MAGAIIAKAPATVVPRTRCFSGNMIKTLVKTGGISIPPQNP